MCIQAFVDTLVRAFVDSFVRAYVNACVWVFVCTYVDPIVCLFVAIVLPFLAFFVASPRRNYHSFNLRRNHRQTHTHTYIQINKATHKARVSWLIIHSCVKRSQGLQCWYEVCYVLFRNEPPSCRRGFLRGSIMNPF